MRARFSAVGTRSSSTVLWFGSVARKKYQTSRELAGFWQVNLEIILSYLAEELVGQGGKHA
jgi:hypothetical protein